MLIHIVHSPPKESMFPDMGVVKLAPDQKQQPEMSRDREPMFETNIAHLTARYRLSGMPVYLYPDSYLIKSQGRSSS